MKSIPVQEALTSHFCRCGTEVKEKGATCATCQVLSGNLPDSFWGNGVRTREERERMELARPIETGLKCKGGCGVDVVTHKGMGGWCGDNQNGCRRVEIEKRRAEGRDPVPGRKSFAVRRQELEILNQPTKPRNWLEIVAVQISEATDAVRVAQEDLDRARRNLESILQGALETLEKES